MSAIAAGLGWLIGQIANPAGAGGSTVTQDQLGVFAADVANAFTILKDTMDSADSATQRAVTAATDAAAQVEEIGLDVKEIAEHTYHQVIPHSLSWLAGYLISGPIDQLRGQVVDLNHKVAFLMGWRGQINTWRHDHVDPELTAWRQFRAWFDGWPVGVLNTWHHWLQRPGEFASWAAPPLTGAIVSYLGARDHQASRDNLLAIMLAAMREEPDRAFDAVCAWLVA